LSAASNAPRVFISYRRQDAAVVDELISALRDSHPAWRDTTQLRSGQPWRETIVRAIDQAYALILVVSARTESSREVYAECFYALGRGMPVIPLLSEDCELPFGLARLNALTWHRDREQTLRRLKEDLDAYRFAAGSVAPADAIETYLSSLRLAYLLNVGNYTPMLGQVRQRRLRAGASASPLRSVEMQSRFSLRRSSPLLRVQEMVEEVRDHQELLPALHELRRVVLLGEPGIGKTTTLYKFADELRQRCLADNEAPLPVILPLREWREGADFERFVSDHLGGLAGQYRSLRTANRLYLLFDGLNEIGRDAQRRVKLAALRARLDPEVPLVATCRELDYRDEALRLELDTITMHPLEPSRIQDFLIRYLVDAEGEQAGRTAAYTLFWEIAGGEEVRAVWGKWREAGASLERFFQAESIPRSNPDVYSATSATDDALWEQRVRTPANLVHLAANPYLLWMFLNIYLNLGHMPGNRGGLFDEFVFQLLKREGLTQGDIPDATGRQLLSRLEALAWSLQRQAAEVGAHDAGMQFTLPRSQAAALLGGEEDLHRAASASLVEDAEPVRFSHQLLQEYFSGRRLLAEIGKGLIAAEFWPPERWWRASGWEEAVVLAAGMSPEAAHTVFQWLLPVNPEAAAACTRRSGVVFDDERLRALRGRWLPQLTDGQAQPEPARAAIGRALGGVVLASGEALDNRRGVGLHGDGVPDIAWVEIPGGRVVLADNAGKQRVRGFAIACYPVTNVQFQAFVEADDGYQNPTWWAELDPQESHSAEWSEANAPRETVSWYEAVAFSRWLSARLGYAVRLPTEFEWQRAATRGEAGRTYPWGPEWAVSHCNSGESDLDRTTAVGLYPKGAWPGGPLDMVGNVWEWCLNKHDKPMDPSIDRSGDPRAVRGGSWFASAAICRTAFRFSLSPELRVVDGGFRLLCPH
jgi:hypothetical protein